MTAYSLIMFTVWFIAAALVLWVGIKADQKALPVNNWVGIRTHRLMASEENWVTGHKAAATYLKLGSVPLFIGALACLFLKDELIGWVSIPVVVLLVLFVLLAAQKANKAVSE